MNLVIDAGNTLVKLAVFEQQQLIFNQNIRLKDFISEIPKVFEKFPDIQQAMLSSVTHWEIDDSLWLPPGCELLHLNQHTNLPFNNKYGTPHTLGKDRIALAAATFFAYPKTNALIIDAGTCITYDMLTAKGEYLGGAISPGLQMRYKALNAQTANLPLLSPKTPDNLIGDSTENSIHSGVVKGISCEIDGLIDQYKTRFQDLTVILTGGDAHFLSKQLKNTIFAHSNFLLQGLNFLLDYNKS